MDSSKDSAYWSLTHIYYILFRISGILPGSETDDEVTLLRRVLKFDVFGEYCLSVNIIIYSMILGHGVRMALQHRLELDDISENISILGILLRSVIIYRHRWDVLQLVNECRGLWRLFVNYNESATMVAFERKVYYLASIFLWSSVGVATSYIIAAQFIRIPPMEANATFARILPMKFYVDVQDEPWYTIVVLIQVLLLYSYSIFLAGIETIAPFLIMLTCGYLKVISDRLMSMQQVIYAIDELSTDRVLGCVQFHQAILEFCGRMEKLTRSLFMVQVLTTVYNMSLIAILILKNEHSDSRYVSLFAYNLLQFYTCHWIPQHLFDHSETIGHAVYLATLAHRQFNLKGNKMLLMMLMRAGRPVQLTAGGIIILSLENFKNMMVNAFSFFTVLRSFSI